MAQIKRMHLDLTNKCSLNCSYCYISRGVQSEEMTKEDWLEIIDQAVDIGIKAFIVSGGEPLYFPEILDIIDKFKSYRAKVSLMTNLWEIDQKIINGMVASPAIKEIVTSLDGFDGHNAARPPSDWQDIINTISFLRKEREDWRIYINTVLNKYNLKEVFELQKKVAKLGIDIWRVDLPIKSERLNIFPDFSTAVEIASRLIIERYTHPELQKTELVLFRIYKSQLENIQLDDALSQSDISLHPCEYFLGTIAIKPDRTITLCSPIQFSLGKITKGSNLREVLGFAQQNNFFDLKISDLKDCKNCKYIMLCGGGCRADALRWTGKINNADPISCIIMPVVEKVILPILSSNLKEIYRNLLDKTGEPPRYRSLSELLS